VGEQGKPPSRRPEFLSSTSERLADGEVSDGHISLAIVRLLAK
jgi:hypothetical protein